MPDTYDALIAGAGPAGCAGAYDLARGGRRVLMLDTRSFPRPKACACGLTRKTLAALRYPVDAVTERVSHQIVLQRATHGELVADKSAELRVRARTPIAAMAVRQDFDAYCLAQTLAASARGGSVTLRKIEGIRWLDEGPGQVEIAIATSQGLEHLAAPVLIGADGSNGQIRRLLSAQQGTSEPAWYTRGFALECTIPYALLPSVLPAGDHAHDLVFDFSPLAGGYGWLFPKGDHINIGVGAFARTAADRSEELRHVSRTLLAAYTRTKLGLDLAAIAAPVTGQHLGMGGHAYVPQGRVLLAGDAAGLVDPLTGEGIHSAILSGQAAAAAILRAPDRPAAAYARNLAPLQQTLAFSARAARSFYAQPERGFRVMRLPGLRALVLRTNADGLPHTRLLGTLAKLVS